VSRIALILVSALFAAAARAEPATLIRAAELKKEPATDAPTVAQLAAEAKVNTSERKGGWLRVKTAEGAEGWLKMLLLRFSGAGAAKEGDSGVAQLFNVARTGSSGTQVTTGVRGLDAELLSTAQPAPRELARMEEYAATPEASAEFAAAGPLEAKRVEYPKEEERK
jgi:hypothetical protein